MDVVSLFCDGSCLGNPGPGGWAALLVVVKDGEKVEKLITGNKRDTTNNQMELTAAIEGLKALKRPCKVHIVTDSNYVIKGMTEWRFGWVKKGWRNSANKPVENRDLWEQLIAASAPHSVTWEWVKGHAGHVENERVDEAAQLAAQAAAAGKSAGAPGAAATAGTSATAATAGTAGTAGASPATTIRRGSR